MFKPNAVVAAVVERDGRFLMVEEIINGQLTLNQPGGHLEFGESLLAAVSREALEETAHHFVPEALIGIYQWSPVADEERTFLRFAFAGKLTGFDASLPLDPDIERAVWLTRDELAARREQHRSPLLMPCIDDYLAGRRYPLEILQDFDRK